jgi:hypothetical protein
MAASQAFQPRELTEEQKAKLLEAEQDLRKSKARLDHWSDKVAEAPAGSEDEKKAKEREALFLRERDNAQTQLDKLKVEFGQVSGSEFLLFPKYSGTP